MLEQTYYSFDLEQMGMLPDNWISEIIETSDKYGKRVFLDGKSSSSREPENTTGMEYFVVMGTKIFKHLNWLYQLYASKLAYLAAETTKQTILLSPEIDSGVNINILDGVGARYEWHVDTNPLTGLLFVTTHEEKDGGELVFKTAEKEVIVNPKAGTFLLFDARDLPHTVMPLAFPHKRISIPMNYYTLEATIEKVRPGDLDQYIYS